MERKVVQLIVTSDTEYQQGSFLTLCDDGTIWIREYKYDRIGDGPATNQRFEWTIIDGPQTLIV